MFLCISPINSGVLLLHVNSASAYNGTMSSSSEVDLSLGTMSSSSEVDLSLSFKD